MTAPLIEEMVKAGAAVHFSDEHRVKEIIIAALDRAKELDWELTTNIVAEATKIIGLLVKAAGGTIVVSRSLLEDVDYGKVTQEVNYEAGGYVFTYLPALIKTQND